MTKTALLIILSSIAGAVGMADQFVCTTLQKADSKSHRPRWYVRVNQSKEAGVGRVPGFFLLTTASEKEGVVVATDKRNRISLDGRRQRGTYYSVKLKDEERKALTKNADGRLNLAGAAQATVWIDVELNDPDLDTHTQFLGSISIENAKGESLYSRGLNCGYSR